MIKKISPAVCEEDIRLFLSNSLPDERKKVIRKWFSTTEGQLRLSGMLDEDIRRILSGDNLISADKTEPKPIYVATFKQHSTSATTYRTGLRWFSRAAIWTVIVLLTSIGGYYIYDYTQPNLVTELYVPMGDLQTIVFQDGSKVILNADSRLKFSPRFSFFRREVELDGEAYFEVAHDRKRPFIVHAGKMKIKVLGTQFNVKAYHDDTHIITTLNEGKIRLTNEKGKSIDVLPGEQVLFKHTDQSMQKRTLENTGDFSSWKSHTLYFQDASLNEIARAISRKYNKEIILASQKLGTTIYTINLGNDPLESVLQDLQRISPIQYEQKNNKIIIYPKQENSPNLKK